MTLGDGKTQTDQPADWGKGGGAMVEGLREEGMVGMEGKRRMDAMDLAFTLCSCVGFSSLVMLRPKDKIKTSKHAGTQLVVRKCLFLTCGSRGADGWRWGCRWRASLAGETVSRFWSPASGRSSGRSFAPGSPCTRCALTPG